MFEHDSQLKGAKVSVVTATYHLSDKGGKFEKSVLVLNNISRDIRLQELVAELLTVTSTALGNDKPNGTPLVNKLRVTVRTISGGVLDNVAALTLRHRAKTKAWKYAADRTNWDSKADIDTKAAIQAIGDFIVKTHTHQANHGTCIMASRSHVLKRCNNH